MTALILSWRLSYECIVMQAIGTLPFKNGYAGAFVQSFKAYQNPHLSFRDRIIFDHGQTRVQRGQGMIDAHLKTFTLDAPSVMRFFMPLWLTALTFFFIGLMALIMGQASSSMFSFFVFCSLSSSYLAGLFDFHTTYRLCQVTSFCFGFMPAAILHLAIEFPVN